MVHDAGLTTPPGSIAAPGDQASIQPRAGRAARRVQDLRKRLGGWGWVAVLAAPPILGTVFFMMGSFIAASLDGDFFWAFFTAFWIHVGMGYVALVLLMTGRLGHKVGSARRTRKALERIDGVRTRFLKGNVSPDGLKALTQQHLEVAEKATPGHEARWAGRVMTRYGVLATLTAAGTGFFAFIALMESMPAFFVGLAIVAATAGSTGSVSLANGIATTVFARRQIRHEQAALLQAENDLIIETRDAAPSGFSGPTPTMTAYSGR